MWDCDIQLIGHAVEDTIFDGTNEPFKRWGGIYNCVRAFEYLHNKYHLYDPKFSIKVEPIAYGDAFIRIDRKNSTKEVHANLNKINRRYNFHNAEWTHIAYADAGYHDIIKIPDDYKGTVSIDLIKGNPCRIDVVGKIDYVFFSLDENPEPEEFSKRIPDAKFIGHEPGQIMIWQNGKRLEATFDKILEGVSVLGAGDFLASSFINCLMRTGTSNRLALHCAQKQTQDWLLYN